MIFFLKNLINMIWYLIGISQHWNNCSIYSILVLQSWSSCSHQYNHVLINAFGKYL